mmetsp:Transcript_18585/g.43512  ORF Transcript_18585/g.43512 Transcript_18585/m.43512 type:complete len:128 (+) Transcript_18585:103-486(+)
MDCMAAASSEGQTVRGEIAHATRIRNAYDANIRMDLHSLHAKPLGHTPASLVTQGSVAGLEIRSSKPSFWSGLTRRLGNNNIYLSYRQRMVSVGGFVSPLQNEEIDKAIPSSCFALLNERSGSSRKR